MINKNKSNPHKEISAEKQIKNLLKELSILLPEITFMEEPIGWDEELTCNEIIENIRFAVLKLLRIALKNPEIKNTKTREDFQLITNNPKFKSQKPDDFYSHLTQEIITKLRSYVRSPLFYDFIIQCSIEPSKKASDVFSILVDSERNKN